MHDPEWRERLLHEARIPRSRRRWSPFITSMKDRIEGYRRDFHWPLPD